MILLIALLLLGPMRSTAVEDEKMGKKWYQQNILWFLWDLYLIFIA